MKQELLQNNYIVIKNFIEKDRALFMAKEFKTFCNMNNVKGDAQIAESNSFYNFNLFLELLCEKTPEVSNIAGVTVLPTYSYARVYFENSNLFPHTDRPACEISLSVHLDGDVYWPFFIKTPSQEIKELDLDIGDAVMYLGCKAEHWRDIFKPRQSKDYTQVFLHYVDSNGLNKNHYFDKS